MIWRLLTAVVLAFVILPTGSYLAPDPLEATDLAVADDALAKAHSQVAKVATVYGIKTPSVRFVDSAAAGVTVEKTSSEGRITEIRLGRPIQADAFRLQPDLLDAVLSHETGHAVMIARNEAFPPAADAGTVVGGTGVYNLAVILITKRASHSIFPSFPF